MSTEDGQECRRRKAELHRLLGLDGLDGAAAAVLAHRRAALASAGAALRTLDEPGQLDRPRLPRDGLGA